jgi:predicted RNA-binding protein with EMAP domain
MAKPKKEGHKEQEILEKIIEAHFNALEYYTNSHETNRFKINEERMALIMYIGNYGAYGKHPKYLEYNAKLAILNLK